jgi:type IV secretory pathway VirB3-like protein
MDIALSGPAPFRVAKTLRAGFRFAVVEESGRGRTLFKDRPNYEVVTVLVVLPLFAALMVRLFWDSGSDIPAPSLVVFAVVAALEVLLTKQRFEVLRTGLRPPVRRVVGHVTGAAFIPWDDIVHIRPVDIADPYTGETTTMAFEVTTRGRGTWRLSPSWPPKFEQDVRAIEDALRRALGDRVGDVWRDIAEVTKELVDRIQRALLVSARRQAIAGITMSAAPFSVIVAIMVYIEAADWPVSSIEQLRQLFAILGAGMALLFAVFLMGLLWSQKRIVSHREALGLFVQIRDYEERTEERVLPPMRMLASYRGLDPSPLPVDTRSGVGLVRSLGRHTYASVAAFAVGLLTTLVVMVGAFDGRWPPTAIAWSIPPSYGMIVYGAYRYLGALEAVRDLKAIVREEWRAGSAFLQDHVVLRVWGVGSPRPPEASRETPGRAQGGGRGAAGLWGGSPSRGSHILRAGLRRARLPARRPAGDGSPGQPRPARGGRCPPGP